MSAAVDKLFLIEKFNYGLNAKIRQPKEVCRIQINVSHEKRRRKLVPLGFVLSIN